MKSTESTPRNPGHIEIDHATRLAASALNARAKPWTWGRPVLKPRRLRRRLCLPPLRNAAFGVVLRDSGGRAV